MALDTKQKRGSALEISLPYRQWLAEPDGTLGLGDRASLLKLCAAPLVYSYEQEGFRFRNDDGSEITATWMASQDASVNLSPSEAFRLRVIVNTSGDTPSSAYRLEYRLVDSGDPWEVISA